MRWKVIEWTDGAYSVSDTGLIRSNERFSIDKIVKERILKPCLINSGYYTVHLKVKGKRYSRLIHRLVAETFLDGYFEGATVDHKDCNKLNNNVENLEWVTKSENIKRAYKNGLRYETEKCAIAHARRAALKKIEQSRPIGRYSTDGCELNRFCSLMDAKRQINVHPSLITKAANQGIVAYGCLWKWLPKSSVTTTPQGGNRTGENPAAKHEDRKV